MVMMRSEAIGAASFLEKIIKELWQSVYVALGGSLDDGYDWANRGLHFAAIAVKILILLAIVGFFYWLLVYSLKHMKDFLGLSKRQMQIARSVLRYLWLIAAMVAIMTQVGVKGDTIKAFAKASSWAGFFYVAWTMKGQMVESLLKYYELNESIGQLLKNLMAVLIGVLASGIILAQFGFDIVSIVAGLGIAGLAVGFAAQSTLANFIAGIAILVEQSFQVGDWIRIGTQEGRVVNISLRTTHILDRDNIIIIFPNSTVASSEVVNLTSKTFIRFDVPVRAPLDVDVDRVRSLVLGVLKQNESVLSHPLSTVTLDRVGEYDVVFTVRFWVSPAAVARLPILKEHIIEAIKKTLDTEGIVPPYPHMHLVGDGNYQVVKPKETTQDGVANKMPIISAQDKQIYGNHTNHAQTFPDGS